MKRTIIYTRVSTEEQATNGVSLADQAARCTSYAHALQLANAEVVTDAGYSAKSLKRPGIQAILEAARDHRVDAVIVLKLDRLTRNLSDLLALIDTFRKYDVKLLSATDALDTSSASGRMVVNMLGVVAQWEREQIAERVTAALAHKRRQRTTYCATPYGYRRDGNNLVPDDHEQAVIAQIRGRAAQGASLRSIAAELNAAGEAPHRGREWYSSTIASVLRSKIATEVA